MSEDLHNISRRFMREPLHFKVEKRSLERIGLKHFYVYVDTDEWKFETLCDLFETDSLPKVAIFCNTWDGVAQLAIRARGSHLNVSIMVGNISVSVVAGLG
jgi:superfamily II DNA/RNA helicase